MSQKLYRPRQLSLTKTKGGLTKTIVLKSEVILRQELMKPRAVSYTGRCIVSGFIIKQILNDDETNN